ncbi:MAG: hypothetical protein ABSG92_10365 [Conexivisphaerales archaeon]
MPEKRGRKLDRYLLNMQRRQKRMRLAILSVAMVAILVVAVVALTVWGGGQPKGGGSVAIVDMFYSQSPNFTDQAVATLQAHGISYYVYKDSEVNVNLYRNLPTFGYKLIILRVHVGISEGSGQPAFLFTAENYSTGKYPVEQLSDQIQPGVINLATKENPVFSIGPGFVADAMNGNFRGATVIISGCYGQQNTLLADAFLKRNATSVIGWDGLVTLDHTDEAVQVMLALIVDGHGVNQSVYEAQAEVGPDPAYNSTLSIVSALAQDYVLKLP